MKKYIYLIVMLCVIACKDEKQASTPEKNKHVRDDVFKVLMDIKVLEDDKFQLFYVDDSPEGSYKVDERIVTAIKGNKNFQIVKFDLPAKVLPYKFRIDVGEKGLETLIEIRGVKLKLNNRVIEFDSTIFDRFFQPNIYIKKVENGFIRKKVDDRCDPFFISKALLIKKIELEL